MIKLVNKDYFKKIHLEYSYAHRDSSSCGIEYQQQESANNYWLLIRNTIQLSWVKYLIGFINCILSFYHLLRPELWFEDWNVQQRILEMFCRNHFWH